MANRVGRHTSRPVPYAVTGDPPAGRPTLETGSSIRLAIPADIVEMSHGMEADAPDATRTEPQVTRFDRIGAWARR